MPQRYRVTSELPVPIEEAFAYHERPGALQRLVPPWEDVTVQSSDGAITAGSRVVLVNRIFGVPVRWVAEHTHYDPPRLFADTQVSGPFARWDHRHQFAKISDRSSTLTDDITYAVPGGAAGRVLGGGTARKTIERMFAYRHRMTRDDLSLAAKHPLTPMTVAVSGSSGMVGSSLCALLTLLGHHVRPIVRSPSEDSNDIAIWSDPAEAEKLSQCDAVVHLAGKSIASGRWTESVKQEIRDSRVIKTRQLCESIAKLDTRPRTFVCASAIGIYGDRGDETLTEQSRPAEDFLADVAIQWEQSCEPAAEAGLRVVNARFGIVLSPDGGALQKTLLPAKMMGGKLGSGRQWWSWIGLDDVVGGLYHALATEVLSGPVNFTAPSPVRNTEFASTLGKVLSRPALFPAPAFALRAALGEMADDLLLASTMALPKKLQESGYEFRFSQLDSLLRYCLGTNRLKSQEVIASEAA